jgi:hypothetical protein
MPIGAIEPAMAEGESKSGYSSPSSFSLAAAAEKKPAKKIIGNETGRIEPETTSATGRAMFKKIRSTLREKLRLEEANAVILPILSLEEAVSDTLMLSLGYNGLALAGDEVVFTGDDFAVTGVISR